MASTHWQFRYCMPFIRLVCGDTGLPVLTAILSHANVRNRCYPSYTHLELITGLSRRSIAKAVGGLVDLRMIRVIPLSERVEDELKLDKRLNVYEASGYLQIGALVIPYLNTDFTKLPVTITQFDEVLWEALVYDVNRYKYTTYTDMVYYVNSNYNQELKTTGTQAALPTVIPHKDKPKPKPQADLRSLPEKIADHLTSLPDYTLPTSEERTSGIVTSATRPLFLALAQIPQTYCGYKKGEEGWLSDVQAWLYQEGYTPRRVLEFLAWHATEKPGLHMPRKPAAWVTMTAAWEESARPAPIPVERPRGVEDCPYCLGTGVVVVIEGDRYNSKQSTKPCSCTLKAS